MPEPRASNASNVSNAGSEQTTEAVGMTEEANDMKERPAIMALELTSIPNSRNGPRCNICIYYLCNRMYCTVYSIVYIHIYIYTYIQIVNTYEYMYIVYYMYMYVYIYIHRFIE